MLTTNPGVFILGGEFFAVGDPIDIRAYHDAQVSSFYKDLILELAATAQEGIDPQTMDYLWNLAPGRIRDLAARIEQANADIRKQALKQIRSRAKQEGVEQEQIEAQAERIETTYASPFEAIDETTGDATVPTGDGEEESEPEPNGQPKKQEGDGSLPPNRPAPSDQVTPDKMKKIVEG